MRHQFGCKLGASCTQFCRFLFAKSSRKLFGMNGGDDGARTRDLCRDSREETRNLLESGGTDGSFQRPEEPMGTVSVSLLCPQPLPC
jgi:hypothetical protein